MRFWIKLFVLALIGYVMFGVSFMRGDYVAASAAEKKLIEANHAQQAECGASPTEAAANRERARRAFVAFMEAEKKWAADLWPFV